MIKLLLSILCDERGGTLSITRKSANTLITSSGFNTNFDQIEAEVNSLDTTNYADDSITAAKLAADVVRSGYGLLQHTDGSLYVDVSDTNPCLEITDGGLRAKVDNNSIERASGGLQVKALGVTSAMLAGSIPDSKLSQLTTADKVANSALSQIIATDKVSGSAITGLTSVPSGAGGLPVVNGGTGATKINRGVATGNSTTPVTITFASPFSNTNYTIVATLYISGWSPSGGPVIIITAKTTTSVTLQQNGYGSDFSIEYFAIGS